jgi:hypothetical protein
MYWPAGQEVMHLMQVRSVEAVQGAVSYSPTAHSRHCMHFVASRPVEPPHVPVRNCPAAHFETHSMQEGFVAVLFDEQRNSRRELLGQSLMVRQGAHVRSAKSEHGDLTNWPGGHAVHPAQV